MRLATTKPSARNALATVFAIVLAACGGDGEAGSDTSASSAATTAVASTSTRPTVTSRLVTTTVTSSTMPVVPTEAPEVPVAVPPGLPQAPVPSGQATGPAPAGPTFEAPTVPTPQPPPGNGAVGAPVSLIGVPALATSRPALVIKIDNSEQARPQFGINAADIVVEELVEGISRFAAVYHSTDADVVGPVRSARTTDIIFFNGWNRPVLAFSGANAGVQSAVSRAPLVNANASVGNQSAWYKRLRDRRSPHNLVTSTAAIRSGTRGAGGTPPVPFRFAGALDLADAPATTTPPTVPVEGAPSGETAAPAVADVPETAILTDDAGPGRSRAVSVAAGSPARGASLTFGATKVEFSWDPAVNGWRRRQGTSRLSDHVDASGRQIAPVNVVIMEVRYTKSAADPRSPEAETVGSGRLVVLTDGRRVDGTWERFDQFGPIRLAGSDGAEIVLAPGQTFIELVSPGNWSVN
jgi:hypothetical protein